MIPDGLAAMAWSMLAGSGPKRKFAATTKFGRRGMVMRKLLLILAVLAVLVFMPISVSAAEPEIVQISPDTYLIISRSRSIFGNIAKIKTSVLKQAHRFAESQGKVAIPISDKTTTVEEGLPTYEYQFRLVDADSPNAKGTGIGSSPDAIVESRKIYSGELTVNEDSESKPDLYTELIKLDDLRKKGVLSDEEFEEQKKRLLGAQ